MNRGEGRSDSPLVSVIMIFLNSEAFLQEAIESVLAQTHAQWELLLVDDGSTDKSTRIAQKLAGRLLGRVKYLEHVGHTNRGVSASRNLGIRHARGEYVAFLDPSDVWRPNKLQEQAAVMQAQPTAAAVYGRSLIWHSWTGRPEDQRRDRFYTLGVPPDNLIEPPRLLIPLLKNRAHTLITCNVMIRHRVFAQVGQFEESLRGLYGDQAFYTKVHLKMPSFVANACWAKCRQHSDSGFATPAREGLPTAARLRYLEWAAQYFADQGVKDRKVWDVLNAELWRCRYPLLRSIPQTFRGLGSAVKRQITKSARRTLSAPVRRRVRAAWERNRTQAPRALCLIYHRVAEPQSDPYQLSVAPRHFAEHLEILRRNARVLPLSQLTEGLYRGRWPRRSLALTFDDGYLDNLRIAKPLLEENGVPATMFVTSGGLGAERDFWWDELADLLLRPGTLPASLTMVVDGAVRNWDLAESSSYQETDARDRGWNVNQAPAALLPRQRFFQMIQELVRHLNGDGKRMALDQLRTWAGAAGAACSDRRLLATSDLVELARGDLIEIGAHSVTHPILPSLPITEQYKEVYESGVQLERLLGRPVTSFAYPHGEYSADTLITVQEAGFLRACTTHRGALRRGTGCFEIPRLKVKDWNGEQFARKLDHWFGHG